MVAQAERSALQTLDWLGDDGMERYRSAKRAGALLTALLAAAGCAQGPALEHGDHPLAGRTWAVESRRFLERDELLEWLQSVDAVVLGEQHTNPRHHQVQAALLDGLVAVGRSPAVAFEMLDRRRQEAVDRVREAHPDDVDALAAAVDWSASGWPAWELYRPVFQVAYRADLPILAANLDRAEVRELARGGWDALASETARALGPPPDLPGAEGEAMAATLRTSHCGLLPESMVPGMLRVQQARNALLARALAEGVAQAGSAVLITGNGHARTDRGAPWALDVMEPALTSLAVGILEVQPGLDTPESYALGPAGLPYQFVHFTAALPATDHCAELRKRFQGSHGDGEAGAGDSHQD